MADVKWIRICTDMINNKKIKRIRTMPEGNNIVLIWVFLIAQAGESNRDGGLFLTDIIPFTHEDLAVEFDFEIPVIQLALITLEKFSMIEVYEDVIYIKNWEEYQNFDGLEKIREQGRERSRRFRDNQKQKRLTANSNVTDNVTVTDCNAIEEELELEKDNKDICHKYGEYKKVLLSDIQLEKLKKEFSDWEERIRVLDEYIECKGKKYSNHYATIKAWDRKAKKEQAEKKIKTSDGIDGKKKLFEEWANG